MATKSRVIYQPARRTFTPQRGGSSSRLPVMVNGASARQAIIQRPQNNARSVGKSRTGAPTFPGSNSGMSIEQIQNYISQQKRVTGVSFTAGAGTSQVQNIQLPGDIKLFLGLIFTPTTDNADTFNIAINNNLFIDNGSIFLHSSDNSQSIKSQYFEYSQPLSGKDSFDIEITSAAGLTGVLQLHYI
jgi:hypothetical protein